jgi:hypothetical protein
VSDLARILELAVRAGAARHDWRAIELDADRLHDDELDLRIDAVRLNVLDVVDRLDELAMQPQPEPEEDPV